MATFRANEIFSDSRFLLIALESVDFRYSKTETVCQLYGSVEAIAIIVCGSDKTYALDMEARLIAFDELRQNIPELDAIIAPLYQAERSR